MDIRNPKVYRKMVTFALKDTLRGVAELLLETERRGLLPEYRERIEKLQAEALQFIQGSGLQADLSITEKVKQTMGKYFEMDPLNPNLDAVETDIQTFGHLLLPRGYGMTINRRHPKKSPKTIRTQAGVVLNLWEAEYFRV